jgi:hypothetical protein
VYKCSYIVDEKKYHGNDSGQQIDTGADLELWENSLELYYQLMIKLHLKYALYEALSLRANQCRRIEQPGGNQRHYLPTVRRSRREVTTSLIRPRTSGKLGAVSNLPFLSVGIVFGLIPSSLSQKMNGYDLILLYDIRSSAKFCPPYHKNI